MKKKLCSLIMLFVLLMSIIPVSADTKLSDGGSSNNYNSTVVWGYTTTGSLGKQKIICRLTKFSGTPSYAYNGISCSCADTYIKQTITATYKLTGDTATYSKTETFPLSNLDSTLSHVLSVTPPSDTASVSKFSQYNYAASGTYGYWRSYNYVQ